MKKSIFYLCTGLVAASLGLSACSNNQNTSQQQKTIKSSSKQHGLSDNDLAGFKNGTYNDTDNKVKFTINKIVNVKVDDEHLDPSKFTIAVMYGSFTNNSKKEVSPEDYFNENMKISQVRSSSDHEMSNPGTQVDDTPWSNLVDASSNDVHPGKTIKFALAWDLWEKSDKPITNKYKVQIVDSDYNDEPIGKPFTIKAQNSSFTVPKSDD